MKKIYLLLLTAAVSASALAQGPQTTTTVTPAPGATMPVTHYTCDADLPRWTFDVNFKGGSLIQNPTWATSPTTYTNALNADLGKLSIANGTSYGVDGQLGFFFGPGNHFGLGAGFMYLSQHADAKLDNFHIEYQAKDQNNVTYRQVVTGYNVKEKLDITNLNIPLVLKYKTRFSKRLGFTADAGVLFNMQMKNKTTTDGSFDYEAIYNYSKEGSASYDNSATPNPNSLLITKASFLAHNPGGDVQTWFAQNRATGANVGLGLKPSDKTGEVSYNNGSVGFIFQPALSIYLSDNVALNLGAYYIYQSFKRTSQLNYRLTGSMASDNTVDYSSVMNTVSATENHSIGANVGLRFLFGRPKDSDMDGIPDKRDKCPFVFGLEQFKGCPDTDKDGIPDDEDQCPTVAGLVQFHGCPDSDNDGIPDKEDDCPYAAGPAKYHGCPDRDGDGIIDKDDACPDKAGLAMYRGCPDTDGDGIPDNEDQCPEVAGPASNHGCPPPPPPAPIETTPLSTPILFEINKTVIQRVSLPVLETAIQKMDEDKEAVIIVEGYTDNTGSLAYNKKLSVRRAAAVKKKLVQMGANPKKIRIIGFGPKNPAASNNTSDGRSQNRRAVMKLKVD